MLKKILLHAPSMIIPIEVHAPQASWNSRSGWNEGLLGKTRLEDAPGLQSRARVSYRHQNDGVGAGAFPVEIRPFRNGR